MGPHRRSPLLGATVLLAMVLVAAGCSSPSASPTSATGSASASADEPSPAAYPEKLTINAPGSAGGGFDQTARAVQAALQAEDIVSTVEVLNEHTGAGGTIGLAQMVNAEAGNGEYLMVFSFVTVGAQNSGDAPAQLDDVELIARLFSESNVIVVPKDSPYQTMEDLVNAMRDDIASVPFGGGSVGGLDHLVFASIAAAAGLEPPALNYTAYEGGGEVAVAILGNQLAAGTSGYSELAGQIDAGEMRALAVTGPERLEGVDIPTLQEAGIDVSLVNWRALAAPPDLAEEDKAALVSAITAMHESETWQNTVTENSWTDFFLTGAEFDAFVAEENERVRTLLEELGLL